MDGALVERGVAAGHGAAAVQGPQRSPLRSIGEAGGAAQVEPPGSAEHDAVTEDDLVDLRGRSPEQVVEHACRYVDGPPPVDVGWTVGDRVIDDHDDLGIFTFTPVISSTDSRILALLLLLLSAEIT